MQSVVSSTRQFQEDMSDLFKEYQTMYRYWLFQMSNGFNILLYGLGSKHNLLEDFRKQKLINSCHVIVNGFFPGLTVKETLTLLTSELLGVNKSFKNDLEHSLFICSSLGENKKWPEIFLVVHNIDGPMLRTDSAQTSLSILAQCSSIHILASVDHINAPLIWDEGKLGKFNWLWHDVTTFEPYTEELSYENSLLMEQSRTGKLALSSLVHITQSLTPNARSIFELLIRHQLSNKKDSSYVGMSFQDCCRSCRERFLVTSDLTLRNHLTEFFDHKLLKSQRGPDGVEYLLIPLSNEILNHFLESN